MNKSLIKEKMKKNAFFIKLYEKYKKYNMKYGSSLKPIRISKNELLKKIYYYENIIDQLQKDLKNNRVKWKYRDNLELIRDYKILSFNGDKFGKVFEYDGCIYRGIYKEREKDFIKLWESGILQTLMNKKYIPNIEISLYYSTEYSIILKVDRVDISNMNIWTYSMIKDACILMSIIETFIKINGYTLIDGHLNNVTFVNGKPQFIDIGSFIPDGLNSFSEEIIFTGCYRMLFENIGNSILARNFPYDPYNNSIWIHPHSYNLYVKEYQYCLKEYRKYHTFHSSLLANKIIKNLFCKMSIKPEYIDLIFNYSNVEKNIYFCELNDKILDIFKNIVMCKKYDINNLLSIGGVDNNFIKYCHNNLYKKKISFLDYNENRCESAYKFISELDYDYSVYMYNYLYGGSIESIKSFKSDLVLAFDLLNNYKVYQYFTIESALNSLCKVSNKYIMITLKETREKNKFDKIWKEFFKTIIIEEVDIDNEKVYIFFGEKK